MKSLVSLQQVLCEAIRSPSPALDGRLAVRVGQLVAPSPRGMTPAERVEVYREQFWLRHVASLEEDYATLGWAIGGGALRTLATEYLVAYPPDTWNLERLGERLPSFLDDAHPEHGELARSAARLDWAFVAAFGAPDAAPFDDTVLARTPEDAWPGARIVFHPSLSPLVLSHPLHDVRDAIQRGEKPEAPASSESAVVVWRDARCYLRSAAIEPKAGELLRALRDGAPLGEACARVAASAGMGEAELGPCIARWFQQWTSAGWVSAVETG